MLDVRRPEIGDLPGILDCLRAYNLYRLEDERADRDAALDSILEVRNALSHIDVSEKCWVAVADDVIVGFCCWDWLDRQARLAETVLISVVFESRAAGIGRLLQQRRLDEMREFGAVEVHTWSDDPNAVRWYQDKFHYQIVGREALRHTLHRFHFRGRNSTWTIHRGLIEQNQLLHLRLRF